MYLASSMLARDVSICQSLAMSIFDPKSWRACTPQEMLAHVSKQDGEEGAERVSRSKMRRKTAPSALVLQNLISPLDLYAYLRARFGQSNGIQSIIVEEDSNNIFHWDYFIETGDGLAIFTGATQEVHVLVKRTMSDADWLQFIDAVKGDFASVGRQKSEVIASFEKWYIFPNRFLSIANRSAELYHSLSTALPRIERDINKRPVRSNDEDFGAKAKARSRLINKVTEACIELPILTPILFETFIGLIVAFMTKPEVRENERLFESFKRSPLDVKIYDLANRCTGFLRGIDPKNEVMARYWTIVNRRNDVIHGNLDPVRDALEVVYFDGKKPLYRSGADRIVHFWRGLLRQYAPAQVLADYLTAHEFIVEIIDHMTPESRATMTMLMSDSQPGWDDKRKKLGILFPQYLHMAHFEGLRHDSDLKV